MKDEIKAISIIKFFIVLIECVHDDKSINRLNCLLIFACVFRNSKKITLFFMECALKNRKTMRMSRLEGEFREKQSI